MLTKQCCEGNIMRQVEKFIVLLVFKIFFNVTCFFTLMVKNKKGIKKDSW